MNDADKEKERTVGIVRIDLEILSDLLDLPKGYKAVRAVCPESNLNAPRGLDLIIEGPLMPHVKFGYEIPQLIAWINSNTGEWGFQAVGSKETIFTLKRRSQPLQKTLDTLRETARIADTRSLTGECPCCGAKGIGTPHNKRCFLFQIKRILDNPDFLEKS